MWPMGLLFDFLSKVIYSFHDHHTVLRLLFISFSETNDVPMHYVLILKKYIFKLLQMYWEGIYVIIRHSTEGEIHVLNIKIYIFCI